MTEPSPKEAPPHILVVDDEPFILKSLELMLKEKGCRVSSAGTGAEGVEKALREPPDVVLLDVMLPDLDGFEVCRRIKKEPTLRHVPVLMLTALNDVFNKVKGLDAGADDFISKPFNDSELRARVWAFLRTKRLHDQLDESYRRLKELEELRDSLTHMIMHDLVAPLTAIQIGVEGVMDRLSTKEPPNETHARMLKTAHEGCRRLMDMLRDVLSVSRMEEKKLPLTREKADIKDLIAHCLAVIDPTRELAQVTIKTEMAPSLAAVNCDPTLIGRVVVNLVSNALKFTPPGGTVTLLAARLDKDLEIQVRDTGLGIEKENLERIFDKFFQGGAGHSSRKGQGLGLAFCRLAIEAHGGRIWAESEPGQGSRFIFRIPAD